MIILRCFSVGIKVALILPWKRFWYIRLLMLPFHILFLPHFLLLNTTKRITSILENLGPIAIKIGQSLSLKEYMVGGKLAKALSRLHSTVVSEKIDIVAIFTKNFGIHDIKISPKPIASASMAQVYTAEYMGEKFAIKVIKPHVKARIIKDFKILLVVAKIFDFFKVSRAIHAQSVMKNIQIEMLQEVDFSYELKNLQKIRQNNILDKNISTPKPILQFCSSTILTTSFIDGIKLENVMNSDNSSFKHTVARNIIIIYLNQVYRDGFFHADIHPGNIIVKLCGEICLVDFGIVSQICDSDRIAVAKIMYSFASNDVSMLISAQVEAGYITQSLSENILYMQAMQDLCYKWKAIRQSGKPEALGETFAIMERFGIQVKQDLLLLNKTIVYLEEIIFRLDYNLWIVASPYLKHWYLRSIRGDFKVKIRIVASIIRDFFCK